MPVTMREQTNRWDWLKHDGTDSERIVRNKKQAAHTRARDENAIEEAEKMHTP